MASPAVNKMATALRLMDTVKMNLENLLEEAATSLTALENLQKATRYETLRKLEIARGYLHDIVDRPVELAELAAVAGVSQFQLLRNFRQCYGTPPATYHRFLRLKLAKQAIDAGHLNCGQAAHRYGFADSSSFSHSYRRVFGQAPVRSIGRGSRIPEALATEVA